GVGVRPTGTDGIFVNGATSVTIGGTAGNAANVIAGNAQNGIRLANLAASASAPLQVIGNFIGTDWTTSTRLANGQNGILLESSTGVQVLDNVISGNGGDGVQLDKSS